VRQIDTTATCQSPADFTVVQHDVLCSSTISYKRRNKEKSVNKNVIFFKLQVLPYVRIM